MKKNLLVAVLCCMGLGAFAQQKDTLNVNSEFKQPWGQFFISAGYVTVPHKLNDKLKQSNLPQISDNLFELGIGLTKIQGRLLTDLEWASDYYKDKKVTGATVRSFNTGIKWRPQYIFFYKKGMLAAAGFDLSYMYNTVSIFDPGNSVDLNNIDPADSRSISLYNNSWYLGPSASFGLFQDKSASLRLTTGYEWNVARASWHSDVAKVYNTTKEGGQGRFFAKLIINY
ncbi:MAG: hypothetical protein ACOVRN_16060 [Flavobacterium sp.]